MDSREPSQQLPLPEYPPSWPFQPDKAIYNQNFTVLSSHGTPVSSPSPTSDAQNRRPTSGGLANRPSVSVACVACRSRHLKCDGAARCARCKADGVECSYVKSRRGWKGPRKNKVAQGNSAALSTPEPANALLAVQSSPSTFHVSNAPMGAMTLATPIDFPDFMGQRNAVALAPAPPPAQDDGPVIDAIAAFFYFFWPSHPFLPPRHHFFKMIEESPLPSLELAVKYVGSCYIPGTDTKVFRDALVRDLSPQNLLRDGYSVQALLIFAIGLHLNAEQERAGDYLRSAIGLALELGMNRLDFAIQHCMGNHIMEECWRRTWWQLFVTDGICAAFNQCPSFQLRDIPTDVPLPCEEIEYIFDQIPPAHTLEDYDDSSFQNEDSMFSSYTYLIDAIRILGKALPMSLPLTAADDMRYGAVELIDTYLVNWTLGLPPSKKDVIPRDGQVDEILFQAHMIISATSIMLHRPRSSLNHKGVQDVTICVTPGQTLTPSQSREVHTAKAIQGAETLSKLMRLPTSLNKHSPFFTCTVVMASVVHLSYWSFMIPDGQDEGIKSIIKLDIGILKALSNTWPIAKMTMGQVRGVAHEMFTSKKAMSIHFWNSITAEQILTELIEESSTESISSGGFPEIPSPPGSLTL